MIMREARPFAEALESREAKSILPTTLRTRDLQRLSPEVRERAMVSAAVTDARFLQETDSVIGELIRGSTDLASARLRLDRYLDSVGYGGGVFSGDLTDLRSLARKNVLLETNLGLALGYGQWKQGQSPVSLNQWPAQELVRVERRRKEREDWPERFAAAGGLITPDGRMIALTNSDVWETLSRFGYPYPPFDFNSGMGVEAVSRAEAEALGLLDPDDDVPPETRGLDEEARTGAAVRNERLRRAVAEQLAGIARFDGNALVKQAPDFSRDAKSMGLPPLANMRRPKPDPGESPPQDATRRMNEGVDVVDATGTRVRLDRETMGHWKHTPDELARRGYLERAIDTLRDPLEVWDQGNQRVFLNTYEVGDRTRWFMVFVRPSGVVDNYYIRRQAGGAERARRGRELLYAAEGGAQ